MMRSVTTHRSRTPLLTAVFLGAGLVLTACSGNEANTADPIAVENVDELFTAVDEELDCPEYSSDDYYFDTGAEDDLLRGRSCANSVIMVFSEDEAVITEIQDMLATAQGGTLPIVESPTWLVADITEVAEGGETTGLDHPVSGDLASLASVLGGTSGEL